MYNSCGLLFLSFGFTMLEFITCDSDGSLLAGECQRMDINHGKPAQNGEAPFKIEPEYKEVTDSELGKNIIVSLRASAQFKGFMLDARKCDECASAGRFHLIQTEPNNSILICDDRVVAQSNNQRKTIVNVLWIPEETGVFFFRAAFVEDFSIFWLRKPIILTTTASPTTESTSHSTQTSPTVALASPPQCLQYMRYALALLLFSRLCFLGGSSLLMIFRPASKMATMIASVFEPASKTIAVIFVLIKLIKYECACECDSLQIVFSALTVAAMVSSLLHTLTVFLYCGPSHELRKCWLCAIIIVGLMNTIITTTAIFFEIWCFQERWLPLLMGVFVVWEFMLYLGSVCCEQMEKYRSRKNQNRTAEKRISPWLFMFIIFSVFNAMFTAALITGVSLVKTKNS
ncbi:uncharacterized protein LOC122145915 isoform X2 [Cyprinus carpio]|uniref:Uncharacterized protein LOC122145915 isoform X2 n=1 Tax=Cyprinus carpio TaxID=7962 RepID=A0A9R0B2V3_CYPCA|nr:uncharacterized protein LOC122145915 isoform X2 [Cyprinus carpio]